MSRLKILNTSESLAGTRAGRCLRAAYILAVFLLGSASPILAADDPNLVTDPTKPIVVRFGTPTLLNFDRSPTATKLHTGLYNVYKFGSQSLIIEARCTRGEAPLFVTYDGGSKPAQVYTIQVLPPR